MQKLIKILFWVVLHSCAPASFEDLRWEGEAETRRLARELRVIETKEDLQRAVPRLRQRFNKIAELLLKAKHFSTQEVEGSFASEELFAELARLYEMPGGRELIEMAQNEAVEKVQSNL